MISCTEFIPSYSELFAFLESKYGREEVNQFWKYLFEPDGKGIPLIRFLENEGIRGCWSYWSGTLNEEASDFTMYLNEKRGYFYNIMHKCPSKGRLLRLADEIGITPYHDYCLHCDSYRLAAEKAGFKYIYNFEGVDHAACSMLIYDPKLFDGRVILDEDTKIMDRKASDNEYFHRDFHSSLNMGIDYLAKEHGVEALKEYLRLYTEHVYTSVIKDMKTDALKAIESKIRSTYQLEKAEDVLKIENDGHTLTVSIKECPAVKHLHETGRTVSEWFSYSTEIVMETLAKIGKLEFTMEYYNPDTGACRYRFTR